MAVTASRLLRGASWSVVDQALSAASNLGLSVVVARSVSAPSFGAFAMAFVVFGIAVAVTKAVVGQPLQIRFSGRAPQDQHDANARALGCAVLIGLAGSVLLVTVGLSAGGIVGAAMLALAVALPALLLQDSCRMAMFAVGAPRQAALIDTVWVVVQFSVLIIALTREDRSVVGLIAIWGGSAALSAMVGLALLRVRPRLRAGYAWLVEHRDLTRYLFAEYLLGLGAMQVAILLVGAVASASAVGALRAAQVLLGPLGIVGLALFQFAVPEIARNAGLQSRRLARFAVLTSAALGALTVAYGTVLLLLPDEIGVSLFGETWAGAQVVLLAMTLSSFASACANGPACVLYGMGQARVTYRINLAKGPVLLGTVLLGTWLWSSAGAAYALAFTEFAVLPAWVIAFRRFHRTRDEPVVYAGAPDRDQVCSDTGVKIHDP
jgi:O-antigen/teichoic acid export membrane protein